MPNAQLRLTHDSFARRGYDARSVAWVLLQDPVTVFQLLDWLEKRPAAELNARDTAALETIRHLLELTLDRPLRRFCHITEKRATHIALTWNGHPSHASALAWIADDPAAREALASPSSDLVVLPATPAGLRALYLRFKTTSPKEAAPLLRDIASCWRAESRLPDPLTEDAAAWYFSPDGDEPPELRPYTLLAPPAPAPIPTTDDEGEGIDHELLGLLKLAIEAGTHRFQGFPFVVQHSPRPQIRGVLLYLAILINPAAVVLAHRNFRRKVRNREVPLERCKWYLDDVDLLMSVWRVRTPVGICVVCDEPARMLVASGIPDGTDWGNVHLLDGNDAVCGHDACVRAVVAQHALHEFITLPLTIDGLLDHVCRHRTHPEESERYGDRLVLAFLGHLLSIDDRSHWEARRFFGIRAPTP